MCSQVWHRQLRVPSPPSFQSNEALPHYRREVLLQDEVEDLDDEDDGDEDEVISESDTSHSSADDSDEISEDGDALPMDDAAILANKKASPYFAGLHRSKGLFWLATRPFQMGSWSTAGAILTLGSEMPWFCCASDEDLGADEETMKAIRADFKGEWGDRRQELVLIGEKFNIDGLTKLLDGCLITRAEKRKWEKVMHDRNIDDEMKEEKLSRIWDDGHALTTITSMESTTTSIMLTHTSIDLLELVVVN